MLDLAAVQEFMRDQRIDAWLLYDYRGNNPILAQLLPGKRWTTRRAVLHIPARGDAVLLAHSIDATQFGGAAVKQEVYLSWPEFIRWLVNRLAGTTRVAMEYAPGGTLPHVSMVDGGTIDLVRALGVEVVSSANLIQVCVARWSPAAREQHMIAQGRVTAAKDAAFELIRRKLAAGQKTHECEVQEHILKRFSADGLETHSNPIVAVNAHSGDPHYEPKPETSAPIKPGDWVLIDLWARRPGDQNIYSDITWVGFAGNKVPPKQQEVFEVVKRSRDNAVERAVSAWKAGERLQGWQLDDAAREPIIQAGYERQIRHRTGHSLSPGPDVHGLGVNCDNLETHDTRELLPGIGFTIEPGVYLPEFGVRLEIDLWVDPERGPIVTSCIQNEVLLLG